MRVLLSRYFWIGFLIVAVAYGASWWLRQNFVESPGAALICNSVPHPPWCIVHFAVLSGQHNSLFGAAALVTGVTALFGSARWPALAAAALAVVAIVNYNVEMGALALVLGLLASVKKPPASPRGDVPRA